MQFSVPNDISRLIQTNQFLIRT